jgi:hypothetical protein
MPTICELKIKAKAKGIKGYSGLNKAELIKLVESGEVSEKTKSNSFQTGKWFNTGTSARHGTGPVLYILKGGSKKGDDVEFRIGKEAQIYKRKILQLTKGLYINIPAPKQKPTDDGNRNIYAMDLYPNK